MLAATALSFWLSELGGVPNHVTATAVVLIVAVIKMHVIGMYFMELAHAPLFLRAAFHAWCGLCFVMLIGPYILR